MRISLPAAMRSRVGALTCAAHTIDLPLLLGEPFSWQHADLVKGVDEATLLEHGQRMRELWADFARNGQLAATGHIEPQVLEWWEVS